MTIQVYAKEVYGNKLYYVKGKEAGPLAALTGKKTLTKVDIGALRALGLDVNVTELPGEEDDQ